MISSEMIIGGIVLGLISSPVSIIKKPRFFWGSAAFDPISFFWMIAFFLYGPIGALISSVIGGLAIGLFSKEATPWLGAFLKCTGTFTVWGTYWIATFLMPTEFPGAAVFSELSLMLKVLLAAGIVRCIVEIPLCYWAIPCFLSISGKTPVTSGDMVKKFGGPGKYVAKMTVLNLYLTFLDGLFSWAVVYPTGMFIRLAAW